MKHYTYMTKNTCSTQVDFDVADDKIYNVKFTKGCQGNLVAISKLLEGQDVRKIVDLLEGNVCGPRPTSCSDQLAKGIIELVLNQ